MGGNGPSGITLSYMLSGYTPYYTGAGLSDEYLHNRLMDGKGQSLYEQDLDYLSSGLEGRSNSTVALLFDALSHPMLTWAMRTSHCLSGATCLSVLYRMLFWAG